MTLRIIELVDAGTEPDFSLPALACGQDDLCQVHRDLLEAADRGGEYLSAAVLVNSLSSLLDAFPGADPRMVGSVMAGIVLGLRLGPLQRGETGLTRFALAYGWLDQLRIQKRAAKARAETSDV
jgi:hypothetical protein